MIKFPFGSGASLVVLQGDIVEAKVDAIVNAANETMLGGGGVDGAIHQHAGPELAAECRRAREVRPGVRCPTGEARMTAAYRLPARHVIHTVGPIYKNPEESAPLLAAAYCSSLALANASQNEISTIALPAISCGAYGYPLNEAATIALEQSSQHFGSLTEIQFVLFDRITYDVWLDAAETILS